MRSGRLCARRAVHTPGQPMSRHDRRTHTVRPPCSGAGTTLTRRACRAPAGRTWRSLFSPTPLIVPSSASVAGRSAAICRSVASWKTTYAGHALLLGRRRPPGPQPLEQRARPRPAAQLGRGGPRRGRRGRAGRPRAPARGAAAPSRSPRSTVGAAVGQRERAVVALDREQALGEQLPDDAAPLGLAQLGADAEDGQRVVPVLGRPCRCCGRAGCRSTGPAPKRWLRSRCSRSTVDSSFCAGDRAVPRLRRRAGRCRSCRTASLSLAEVGEQLHPAALDRLAEREHRVEVRGQRCAGARGRPRRRRSSCAAAPRPAARTPARRSTAAPSRPARPVSW